MHGADYNLGDCDIANRMDIKENFYRDRRMQMKTAVMANDDFCRKAVGTVL